MDYPVLILCGGLGTRLRSVVADRPKVLALVDNRPFLARLLDRMIAEGHQDFVLCAGYLAEQIEAFAQSYGHAGIRVIREPEPLGTGGALRFAVQQLHVRGRFAALNGDTFFSGSVQQLMQVSMEQGDLPALAVTEVQQADRYGQVVMKGNRIVRFEEKRAGLMPPIRINAGVYALQAEAFLAPNLPDSFSLERTMFPVWAEQGWLLGRFYPDAVFLDMGTPEDYARAAEVMR